MTRLLFLSVAGALASAAVAGAQSGVQMTFQDDGSGPQMLHMSLPDHAELRRPDYERVDLPLFARRLLLSEPQQAVVERLLEAYLEAFGTLVKETLPAHAGQFMPGVQVAAGPATPGEAGDASLDTIVHGAMGELPDLSAIHELDIEAGPGMVAVMVGVGGEDMGEGGAFTFEADDGAGFTAGTASSGASVFVEVGGPEVELPEEVRQKLEAMAQEMAERIQAHVEQQMVEGKGPAGLLPDGATIEERKAEMQRMMRDAEAFAEVKAELARQFVGDVQDHLTAEQLELWPGLDRALVRRKTLPRGRLDGERLDLFQVVDQVELTPAQRDAIAGLLEQYELDLHGALVRRNEFIETAQKEIDEALDERKPDRAISLAERAADLRVAVRTVNQSAADSIAAALEQEAAARFRERVLALSHPRLYRPTRAERAFHQARAIKALDPALLATMDELEQAFQHELEQANEQVRQTILRHQPGEPRRGLEHFKAMMEGQEVRMMGPGAEEDPIRQAYARRSELEERYMKLLYGHLTAEQVASLPKLPSQARRGPMIIHRAVGPDAGGGR
jgi:hypothetical protein